MPSFSKHAVLSLTRLVFTLALSITPVLESHAQTTAPQPDAKPDPAPTLEADAPSSVDDVVGGINTEVSPRATKDDKGILTFQLENDLFTGTDRHYTNGVRVSYLSAENNVPDWVENLARPLPFFADEGNLRVAYALGQTMYTPEDITIAAPQPDQRPWAGFAWGTIGLTNDAGSRLDNLELILGVVGPASQADDTQEFVHDLIDTTDPNGWDNQLHNEPIVNLSYKRSWRGWAEFETVGLEVDTTPYVGGALGNAFTHANAGFLLRVGEDLPADYGPPVFVPRCPDQTFSSRNKNMVGTFSPAWTGVSCSATYSWTATLFATAPVSIRNG